MFRGVGVHHGFHQSRSQLAVGRVNCADLVACGLNGAGFMTNCRQRMLYGRTSANPPSRFLGEIPEENLEWFGKPEPRVQRSAWEDDESDGSGSGWGDADVPRSGAARDWTDHG